MNLPPVNLPPIKELVSKNGPDGVGTPEQRLDNHRAMAQPTHQRDNPSHSVLGYNAQRRQGRTRINPYKVRADEIGPRHGIPGVGSLENLLTPPGWQLGDEPIDEEQADQLYERSRQQALDLLDKSVNEFKDLPEIELESRIEKRNRRWDSARKLDEFLRAERIKVFNVWQVYKKQQKEMVRHSVNVPVQQLQQVQQFHQSQQQFQQSQQAQQMLMTHHPVPQMTGQQMQQFGQTGSPMSTMPSPPVSGGNLFARLQYVQHGKSEVETQV